MTLHLPDSWESLPALAAVLDPGRLTELFGHQLGGPLRTSHLRYKPGVSVVARVDAGTTGAVHWVAAYAPAGDGGDKLEKVLARAARDGRPAPVLVADVPGRPGHRLAVGTISTDPELRRALAVLGPDRARRLGQPGDPARLLRYNPRRRAVLTGADSGGAGRVTKLTAGPAPADPVLLTRLAAAGIPVLAPVPVPGLSVSPHVLHYPWFGDGDLAARAAAPDGPGPGTGPGGPVLQAAAAAGTALAQLHERGPALLGPARVGAPWTRAGSCARWPPTCPPSTGGRASAAPGPAGSWPRPWRTAPGPPCGCCTGTSPRTRCSCAATGARGRRSSGSPTSTGSAPARRPTTSAASSPWSSSARAPNSPPPQPRSCP